MKQPLAWLALASIWAFPVQAQSKIGGEPWNLKGPVRTMCEVRSNATQVNGRLVEGARLRSLEVSFDEKGNLTHLTSYPSGTRGLKHAQSCAYDDQGNPTRCDAYQEQWTLTIRMLGHLIFYVPHKTERTNQRQTTFICDAQGRFIEQTHYNLDGSVITRFLYNYGEHGDKMIEGYSANGALRQREAYFYDAQGRLRERRFYNLESESTQKWIYSFDESGRKTGVAVYEGDGRMSASARFDARGNLSEQIHYGKDGDSTSKASFTYEFDSRGNWSKGIVEVKTIKNGRSSVTYEVIRREVAYY